MRSRFGGWAGAVGATLLGVAASLGAGCGDEGTAGPPVDPDAGADGGVDAAPVRTPFGLDTRPVNRTCVAPARPAAKTSVKLVQQWPSLSFTSPVYLTAAPGDATRLFVVEQGGRIWSIPLANPAARSTFVDVSTQIRSGGETGLLGMAFHPAWQQNRTVYLYYTAAGGASGLQSVLQKFVSADGGQTLTKSTDAPVLVIDQPASNHNGGWLSFGPDGFLYWALGDGGGGGDTYRNGQNMNSLLAKILRLDVSTTPYGIPPTNPFASGGGAKEAFAVGLRNPFRCSFDRGTGDLWCGDVGQGAREEVDLIKLGGNYGWPIREGKTCYGAATCNTAGLTDPIVDYPRSDGTTVTGGYVYRGKAVPDLAGKYVYADFGTGRIWALTYDTNGVPTPQQLNPSGPNPNVSSFGEDLAGELYVVDYGGRVYALAPESATPPPSTFPQKLSATGCVDPADPTKPAPGLVPFGVRSPLWSDGADKGRFLALPEGTKIGVGEGGHFDFPNGTVLLKSFSVGGRRAETRLLVRHDDGGWAGYSYAWNDAQTDADLLPANESRSFGGQPWYFPSRAECLACHTQAAGRSLGPEIGQLNYELVYPNNRLSNQLATLDHIGMFSAPLAGPVDSLARFPAPTDPSTGALEQRARAYLHANCAHCHRPTGTGGGTMDLRFGTALAAAGLCDVRPNQGDMGITGARLIAPGDPSRSILSARLHAQGVARMPPLASSKIDDAGVAVIDEWIRSLTRCP